MRRNGLENPVRLRLALRRAQGPALLACTACPERSRREHSECALTPPTALPSRHPEGQPFRPEGSQAIGTRTRCFAALRAGGASPDATPTTEQGKAQKLALSPSTSLRINSAEVEPPCGRERSESPQPKSRAQPRDRERSRKTYPERTQKRPFLIATRTYSPQESTHCKQTPTTRSNRNKIHFGLAGNHGGAGASKVIQVAGCFFTGGWEKLAGFLQLRRAFRG